MLERLSFNPKGLCRMSHAGNRSRPRNFLGTRALAVLSCALALLAAQPLLAAPRPAVSTQAAPVFAQTAAVAPSLAPTKTSRRQQIAAARARDTAILLSSARRLHILATVEILHRLLAVDLQPPTFHQAPAFICPPVLLAILPPAPAVPASLPARAPPRQISLQQRFLITRTLLAPPVA
jgi:hypothetical protein